MNYNDAFLITICNAVAYSSSRANQKDLDALCIHVSNIRHSGAVENHAIDEAEKIIKKFASNKNLAINYSL